MEGRMNRLKSSLAAPGRCHPHRAMLVALLVSHVAAWADPPATQTVSQSAARIGPPMQTFDVLAGGPESALPLTVFHERFEVRPPDVRRWNRFTGAAVGDVPERSAGLTLARPDRNDFRPIELVSTPMDLSNLVAASVSLRCRAHGRDGLSVLHVEYAAAGEAWKTLLAVTPPAGPEVFFTRLLPLEGLHSASRIRIRTDAPTATGRWALVEFRIDGLPQTSVRRVHVSTQPSLAAWITFLTEGHLADRGMQGDGDVDVAVDYPGWLVAPAYLGGWRFHQWTLDGRAAPPGRWLKLDGGPASSAIAAYLPSVEADIVPVRVEVSPVASAAVDVASGPGVASDRVYAPCVVQALPGETLLLRAGARTGEAAFWHWRINERRMPDGLCDVLIRADGPMTCVAEYGLLGDMNGDRRLDKEDIEVFLRALVDPDGYAARFPGLDRETRGDLNADGEFDEQDIDTLIDRLTGP